VPVVDGVVLGNCCFFESSDGSGGMPAEDSGASDLVSVVVVVTAVVCSGGGGGGGGALVLITGSTFCLDFFFESPLVLDQYDGTFSLKNLLSLQVKDGKHSWTMLNLEKGAFV